MTKNIIISDEAWSRMTILKGRGGKIMTYGEIVDMLLDEFSRV